MAYSIYFRDKQNTTANHLLCYHEDVLLILWYNMSGCSSFGSIVSNNQRDPSQVLSEAGVLELVFARDLVN